MNNQPGSPTHCTEARERRQTVGVRALVFDIRSRVLLVKHTYRSGWHTPGGGVNDRESPHLAIVREVWEETGIRPVEPPRLHSVHINSSEAADDFPMIFVMKGIDCEPVIQDRAEILEAAWFYPDDLPFDITSKTRTRINEYLNGLEPSPTW